MVLYADNIPSRSARDIFEFESSLSEAMGAGFDQAMFENPVSAINRITELNEAMYGRPVIDPGTQGSVSRLLEPETPIISADAARVQVSESGLDIAIPDEGIREGVLNIMLERKREERKRQVIIGSAPGGSVPLVIASGFAASALDPLNIASAFIPVLGEAKMTALLAKASGPTGRFGVRAGIGATEGAVGAAVVEPLILAASAQDQADYDMADSLLNIAFGTVLGGGLHAIGGAISDKFARPPQADSLTIDPTGVITDPQRPLELFEPESIRDIISKQAEIDLTLRAEISAKAALLDEIEKELSPLSRQKVVDVRDLKKERADLLKSIERGFADSEKRRAKEFQKKGLSRKKAEQSARDAIAQDKADAEIRINEIESRLKENRTQEQARQDIAVVRRGEIPERYQERLKEETAKAKQRVQKTPIAESVTATARDIASAAPHTIRASALKSSLAQLAEGKAVDVEDVFRIIDNQEQALDSIKAKRPEYSQEDISASSEADKIIAANKDDLESLRNIVADEELLINELSEQLNIKPNLKEVDDLADDAQAYAKAYRAYAVCSMRTQ